VTAFEHLPVALRRLRIERRFTQAELAAKAGLSRSRLSSFERGVARPPLPTLERLLATLGADAAMLAEFLASAAAAPPEARRRRYRKPVVSVDPPSYPQDALSGLGSLFEAVAKEALQLPRSRSQPLGR